MRHYRSYQGRRRSRFRGLFKGALIVLLVLLLLLLASTVLLQRYVIYGDDGVRLELPWTRTEPEQVSPSPSAPASLPPIIKEETPAESSPVPELPEPIPMLHAVSADTDALLSGIAATAVDAVGADTLVLTMKEEDGSLNFVTNHPLAVRAGVSAGDPALNDAIRGLTAGELRTVAQVSCFLDHRMSSVASEHKLSTASGYCWEDYRQLRWTSPADQEVRDYLTALCVELAELGFDEILLTNCGYPAAEEGDLSRIKPDDAYPAGLLDQVIAPFLRQVAAALEPYEVRLSVLGRLPELKGDTADTGLTLANALESCDRIWLAQEDWDAAALAVVAADPGLDPARTLVSIAETPESADASWAVLN